MLPQITAYLTEHLPAFLPDLALHSPGRINLIGEHTDYTGGLVLPAAIDKGIEFYVRRRGRGRLLLHAVDVQEHYVLPLPVGQRSGKLWVDYLAGIVREFTRLGHDVPGLEVVFGGNVPPGAGLSSSAALEGGMAFALNELTEAGLSRPELAALCQRSSNGFLGIPSGIMDQFASLNGRAEGALLLDCHTLSTEAVNTNLPGYEWVLADSGVTHELSAGEYHVRVKECATALSAVQQGYPAVGHLSGATRQQLNEAKDRMPLVCYRRAAYVLAENDRVRRMKNALGMTYGAADAVGFLLNETHRGLRDEYEVSCPEIDFLQLRALKVRKQRSDVPGARLMGGGFGGCTLNLVRSAFVEEFREKLTAAYREAFGSKVAFYPVRTGPGTRIISA